MLMLQLAFSLTFQVSVPFSIRRPELIDWRIPLVRVLLVSGKRLIVGVCLFIQDHGGGRVLLSGRRCASRYANAMIRPNSVSTVLSEAEGLFSIFTTAKRGRRDHKRVPDERPRRFWTHVPPPSNRLQTNTGGGGKKKKSRLIDLFFFFFFK